MFSFLSDSGFWILGGVFVAGLIVETFLSFSPPILQRRPNALLMNNFYILALLGLLIYVFFTRGFLQGVMVVIMAFIAYVGVGRVINSRIEDEIFKGAAKKTE